MNSLTRLGKAPLRGRADATAGGLVVGFAYDPERPDTRLVVELWVDEHPIALARADLFRPDLLQEGLGDGCHGFVFVPPAGALRSTTTAVVRLANTDTRVGEPLTLRPGSGEALDFRGGVRWEGGTRFSGWLPRRPDEGPLEIRALVEETLVAETLTRPRFGDGLEPEPVHAFDLFLPARFADGRARLVTFVTDRGEEVPGSPVAFLAFEDGLTAHLERQPALASERARLRQFDRYFPAALPFSAIRDWARRFPAPMLPAASKKPVALLLVGTEGIDNSVRSLSGSRQPWVAGAVPTDEGLGFATEDLLEFCRQDAAESDVVVLAYAGTQFHPAALAHFAAAFAQADAPALVYADLFLKPDREKHWPLALPAFDLERLREQAYCARLFALRRDRLLGIVLEDRTSLVDLALAAAERAVAEGQPVVHIPEFLAEVPPLSQADQQAALREALARRVPDAVAEDTAGPRDLFPAVRLRRPPAPGAIDCVIPVCTWSDDLLARLRAGENRLSRFGRVILAGRGEATPRLPEAFDERIHVLTSPGPWNPGRLVEAGIAASAAPFVLVLDPAVEPPTSDVLDELLSRMVEDVAAVAPVLVATEGVIRDRGLVLGARFAPQVVSGLRTDDPSYLETNLVAHEVSALSGTCFLLRRSDFEEVGRIDHTFFGRHLWAADLCLRLRSIDRRITLTSHAFTALTGHPQVQISEKTHLYQRELELFRNKWGFVLENDPFYNPQLTADSLPFSALAWPPRNRSPRTNWPRRESASHVAKDRPSQETT